MKDLSVKKNLKLNLWIHLTRLDIFCFMIQVLVMLSGFLLFHLGGITGFWKVSEKIKL